MVAVLATKSSALPNTYVLGMVGGGCPPAPLLHGGFFSVKSAKKFSRVKMSFVLSRGATSRPAPAFLCESVELARTEPGRGMGLLAVWRGVHEARGNKVGRGLLNIFLDLYKNLKS